VYVLSPLPRHSRRLRCLAHPAGGISLPREHSRVGLRIIIFEACSAFTSRYGPHTRAATKSWLAFPRGFSQFVTSLTAPVASGWSIRRVGLAPTGKRRLITAHMFL